MLRGQQLTSRNRRFRAVLQYDGNFVLYAGGDQVLWASDTVDKGFRVLMQRDGNLALYDDTKQPLWVSQTQFLGDFFMCLDNGNMAVFAWNGTQVWSSNTTQSKKSSFSNLLFLVDVKFYACSKIISCIEVPN